jgi:UDP-glucose 4-epimerase
MKILVAGGAGYIGSCTTEYLLDQGHEVVVLDALVKGHRDAVDRRAAFVQAHLRDAAAVDAALAAHRPEGIVHFAAFIEVAESMTDPGRYFRNNVSCGLNLLEAAVKNRVRKVVFSSTAAVYGMPERVPIPESEPTRPVSAYGESKLMFERILSWYQKVYGLQYTALRYFNAAGASARYGEAHHPESHLIPIVMEVAEGRRAQVKILGTDYPTPDGTCIRDYVHVLDLAQAHMLALTSEVTGCLNLGSGTGHSVRAVIDAVRTVTGRPIAAVEAERRPGDPPRLISDSSAARRALGWQPAHDDLHRLVDSAWQWRLRHPDGYGR